MKVIAINSSPHKENGNTAFILDPFLQGMKEAGAEIDLFYTNDLKINSCRGDLSCMNMNPGICVHDDDMKWLLPLMEKADIWVIASPLYCDNVSGPMKILMDRLVPLLQPFVEYKDGRCRHPLKDKKTRKVVLVSNCGFWEIENFDPVIVLIKAFTKNIHGEFAGALLRPHGPSLKKMVEIGLPVSDVLDSAKKAGSDLISEGIMNEKTLNNVSRPLKPRDIFLTEINTKIQNLIHQSPDI